MKAQKLMDAVETLKDDLEGSLIATDIWSVHQGISLAGYNSQPKAVALFNKVTTMINKTLTGSNFPELGKYYILDLVDEKAQVFLLPAEIDISMERIEIHQPLQAAGFYPSDG